MDQVGPGEVELRVHGLTLEDHGRVPARVFANKLKQLVSVLEAADAVANGKASHIYVLRDMHMSNPTALLAEIPVLDNDIGASSGIPVFNEAVESIKTATIRPERLGSVVKKIGLLTSGVDQKFRFAEVRTASADIIRIDNFLRNRISMVARTDKSPWFGGAVFGSFDGVLDYVDARGQLPQIKITLSAGGKEIDCTCRREDIETLGDSLKKRVSIFGRAIYEDTSPLPVRVEVTSIKVVSPPGDFSRWRGAFRPFELEPWESNP